MIEKSSFFVVGKVVIDMLNVVKEKLELNKYHATNFYIHPIFNHTINDIPDKITFDLEPNEKIFRLIPIIKDIDNPENVLNKFKLGIVTTLVDTISNRP